MLSEILRNSAGRSRWVHWVATHESRAARETRELLDICFLGLPPSKRSRLSRRIQCGVETDIEATIYEILTYEFLHRFGLAPDFDPRIDGKTPDIAVEISGIRFIVEVLVTHSPSKTITNFGNGTYRAIDRGERAKKIFDTVTKKSDTYAKTGLPLILFIFLGDYSILTDDIEKALFSRTIGEIEEIRLDERSRKIAEALKLDGVFLSNDWDSPSHPNLSAVVACHWFDTLNRGNPGRRLLCEVLHHYSPHVPLPLGIFSPFPEVTWYPKGFAYWESRCIGQWNIVARFAATRQLEFGRYTADAPW